MHKEEVKKDVLQDVANWDWGESEVRSAGGGEFVFRLNHTLDVMFHYVASSFPQYLYFIGPNLSSSHMTVSLRQLTLLQVV